MGAGRSLGETLGRALARRRMSAQPFPISWIRLGEGAPFEAGVYLRASDVAAWLDSLGFDDLAELLQDESAWPATSTHTVVSS